MEQIALNIGINVSTLYAKKKEIDELAEAIKRGQAKGIAVVTNALMKSAKAGNVTAQIFFLKNRDAENWRDVKQVDVGMQKEVKDLLELPEEEFAAEFAQLRDLIRKRQSAGDAPGADGEGVEAKETRH